MKPIEKFHNALALSRWALDSRVADLEDVQGEQSEGAAAELSGTEEDGWRGRSPLAHPVLSVSSLVGFTTVLGLVVMPAAARAMGLKTVRPERRRMQSTVSLWGRVELAPDARMSVASSLKLVERLPAIFTQTERFTISRTIDRIDGHFGIIGGEC